MTKFQDLRVYQLSEKLANEVWKIVEQWDYFAKDTVGKQLVRSADSIGANIAEGNGRYSYKDNQRFVKMARGSLQETQHWLRLACARQLLAPEQIEQLKLLLDELAPTLNAYLNSLNKQQVTNNKQQVTNNKQQVTNNKQQVTKNVLSSLLLVN
jgi:four helix bundle protein